MVNGLQPCHSAAAWNVAILGHVYLYNYICVYTYIYICVCIYIYIHGQVHFLSLGDQKWHEVTNMCHWKILEVPPWDYLRSANRSIPNYWPLRTSGSSGMFRMYHVPAAIWIPGRTSGQPYPLWRRCVARPGFATGTYLDLMENDILGTSWAQNVSSCRSVWHIVCHIRHVFCTFGSYTDHTTGPLPVLHMHSEAPVMCHWIHWMLSQELFGLSCAESR